MYTGRLVFSQVMDHLPWQTFRRCVERYGGNRKVKWFGCADQYRCMAFAQITYRESLRDIETCLRAQSAKLYHMGASAAASRATPWPTPIRFGTGASTPTSPSVSSTRPAASTPCTKPAASSSCGPRSNTQFRRLYSHPADRSSGVTCDQIIVLTGVTTATTGHNRYALRRPRVMTTTQLPIH